jgi:hypothetical protein
MSCRQKAGQNNNVKIVNISFENMAKFKYLRMTVTNENLIHEEIKNRLNSVNAYYHSVQDLLSDHLLSKSVKIKIYKTNLSAVLYGYETWSLTLREECGLRVFENMRICRLKRDE